MAMLNNQRVYVITLFSFNLFYLFWEWLAAVF